MSDISQKNQEEKNVIDLLFQQAIALHQAGQLGQAEQLYRRILQTYPNHTDANHNLGILALQAGNVAASLAHFKLAFDAFPNNPQYVLSYANALLNNGYLLDARKIIKAARQRGLDSAEFKSAQRLIDDAITASLQNPGPTQDEWEPVYQLFLSQKFAELEPKALKLSDKYGRSGKVWKMLAVAQQVQGKPFLPAKRRAAQLLTADIDLHFNLANDLHQHGQTDDAEALLRAAVANNPGNAQAHCILGLFLGNRSRVLEAAASFNKALALDPNHIQTLCAMALLMNNSGQTKDASAFLQRAIAVQNVPADTLFVLAMTLFNLGQFEPAAHQFNRVLEINPLHADAILNLGNVLMLLGLKDDAKKCFIRVLEIQPGAAVAHDNLGWLQLHEGESDNAIASFRRAIALVPGWGIPHGHLGAAYLVQNHFAEALETLQQAATLMPDSADVYCNLGIAHQGLGQAGQAGDYFKQALRRDPNLATAKIRLAELDKQSGQATQA